MRDTSESVEEQYRQMLLSRTSAERLAMACDMFTTARALAEAGLRAASPDLDESALKIALFRRLYGPDLPQEDVERIVAQLATAR